MTVATALVIDDHDLVAASLTYALSNHGLDAHHVQVSDLENVLESARLYGPGVALLDLDLGMDQAGRALDGVELVAPLRSQGWQVLVVTGTSELDRVAAAVAAGAAGWVVKGADLSELIMATLELTQGRGGLSEVERRAMLDRHRAAQRDGRESQRGLAKLTAKEREVLDKLADGISAAQIAEQTYTSIRTVRAHIRSILAKLDVNSQGAATAIARQHRPPPPAISAATWRQLRGSNGQQPEQPRT
ncbi:MAG TPA: response regulator transcription factor [Microlunatus sp.]